MDVNIYSKSFIDDKIMFGCYPKGFTKIFMKASDGDFDAYKELLYNYGEFQLGHEDNIKKYHSIQWAAEAQFSCRTNGNKIWEQMRSILMSKACSTQLYEYLLQDENSEHYLENIDYNKLKSLKR
jgi:hypothetical protein